MGILWRATGVKGKTPCNWGRGDVLSILLSIRGEEDEPCLALTKPPVGGAWVGVVSVGFGFPLGGDTITPGAL